MTEEYKFNNTDFKNERDRRYMSEFSFAQRDTKIQRPLLVCMYFKKLESKIMKWKKEMVCEKAIRTL